jgi:8-amino-7-oxononanoate synthase
MTDRLSDLTPEAKQALLRRIIEERIGKKPVQANGAANAAAVATIDGTAIPESFYRLDKLPQYVQLQLQRALVDRAGIANPFFSMHEGIARDTTRIGGREHINFSTYNYLDLNGHPEVSKAATDAVAKFGTSASASRVVSGERPPHRDLENALAQLHGVEDAVVFVSGHATNVSAISTLMGPKDLILHDRLAHNSIVLGAQLSGAARQSMAHNSIEALEEVLSVNRMHYEKVLIAVEGVYGMDGDAAPLAQLVELKRRHKALLMVDEAHSVGVLGATGRGIGEHAGVSGADVDIWMGTLSKTLSGCGGYIAGCGALIDLLKLTAPGFVYSVGMPPALAAASEAALRIMLREPDRIAKLRANARLFLELAQAKGLDTGNAEGYNIVPVITGRSTLAARLSNALLERGINVAPIVYPAVEERVARLRFFISSAHSEAQIRFTVDTTAAEFARLRTLEEPI